MPIDKYRNQGPDDSEDYHLFEDYVVPVYGEELNKLITDGKKRRDGREWDEMRKIYVKTGVVSSIKGSCYIEVGQTKILVSVYEPREIPRLAEFCPNGELEVEFRFAPFSGKSRRNPMIQNDEKDLGLMLKRALEPAVCRSEFPNCQVDIFVLVLDNDGSSFPAAVTAAGLALADAGITMFDTVAAVTLGIQSGQFFLDPTLAEETFCSSTFPGRETRQMGLVTLAYLPTIGQISSTSFLGCLAMDGLLEHTDLLIDRCNQVNDLSRLTLAQDVLKKLQEEEEVQKKNTEASSQSSAS